MSHLHPSSVLKLASGLIIIFSFRLLPRVTHSRASCALLSGVTFRMRLLYFVLPLLLSVESATADSKAITTTLTTKWANTPLLLEARYVTAPLQSSFNHCTLDSRLLDKWKHFGVLQKSNFMLFVTVHTTNSSHPVSMWVG